MENLKLIINYLVKPHKKIFFVLFGVLILENFVIFINILSIVPVGDYFLDIKLENPNEITKQFINIYNFFSFKFPIIYFFTGVFIFLIFLKSIWVIGVNYIIQKIKFRIHYEFTNKFISKVTLANWDFFLKYPSSSLMQIYTNEITKINTIFTNICIQLSNFFKIIAYLGAPIYLNYKITISFLFMVLILSFPLLYFRNISKQIGNDLITTQRNVLNNILEIFSGIKIIIVNRIQKKIVDSNVSFLKKNIQTSLKFNLISNIVQQSYGPIGILSIVISFIYLFNSNSINLSDISQISAILWALYSTFPILGGLGQILFETNSLVPSLQNFKKITEEAHVVDKSFLKSEENFFFRDEIFFDKVSFAYPGKKVLDNVSFRIYKNTLNIFYGSSGSGKSTIIELLLGMLPIDKGKIFFDKRSLSEIKNLNYLGNFGYVGQENFLFNLSIKENFQMIDQNISNKEINYFLNLTNCTEFVEKHVEKIDYIVGEKGNKLSVGQRQRLCIARAMINKPKILILDEITSALDQQNELSLLKMLDNIKKNTTIILMTHSQVASKFADNLFKVENQKIIKTS